MSAPVGLPFCYGSVKVSKALASVMGGQEAKAFLASTCPTQATLNVSGRDSCLAKDQVNSLSWALKVQFEPVETEYYSVCAFLH